MCPHWYHPQSSTLSRGSFEYQMVSVSNFDSHSPLDKFDFSFGFVSFYNRGKGVFNCWEDVTCGVLKSWLSRPTNKIVHLNPICPFLGSFPSLPPYPCLMLTPFQVFPPLLTSMVWENQLPPPNIHFPSRDVGEKVQYFSPQRRQRIYFHQRFINFSNSIVYFKWLFVLMYVL